MNKFLELLYEQTAKDRTDDDPCPFCELSKREEHWAMDRFGISDLAVARGIEFVCQASCPDPKLPDKDDTCSEKGRRKWRHYRNFFEEDTDDDEIL